MSSKFQFGNVVVVGNGNVGVIVKSWKDKTGYTHDVYVRYYGEVVVGYKERDIQHFIYSKELTEDEVGFYDAT